MEVQNDFLKEIQEQWDKLQRGDLSVTQFKTEIYNLCKKHVDLYGNDFGFGTLSTQRYKQEIYLERQKKFIESLPPIEEETIGDGDLVV